LVLFPDWEVAAVQSETADPSKNHRYVDRAPWFKLARICLVLLLSTLATSARADDFAVGPARVDELSMAQARIVSRARLEVLRRVRYVGTWQRTSGYPMGDIRPDRGACTDLVVRSYRAAGIDLQRLVHEDMLGAGRWYGVEHPDPTIDHRRVSTLLVFFQRNAMRLTTDPHEVTLFAPGDVVFFGPSPSSKSGQGHVAIVSDRIGRRGFPLLLENGGPRPVESDALDRRPIVGHFRLQLGGGTQFVGG
jgi:uncharacterized protein